MVNIENLSLSYPLSQESLKNISFSIKQGEAVLLTGQSGSGKSSIINSINGLAIEYDKCEYNGNIYIYDRNINNMKIYELAKLVFSVFQNPKTYFFNVDTTNELVFYLENIGLSIEEIKSRLKDVEELFSISALLGRDIFELSGGQKQILCMAAAYISGCKILLLDEPSSNLDSEHTCLIADMLKKLKQKGISIIVSEHRIYYLMDIIDRVFLLDKGELLKEYTIDEFKQLSDDFLYSMGIRSRVYEDLKSENFLEEGEIEIKYLKNVFKNENTGIFIENLRLKKGKIYGVVGKNGVGKSTFIRTLIGVEKRSKSEILVDGKKLSDKGRLKISSLVFQDVNHQLFTDTVIGEVILGNSNIDKTRVEAVLKRLDIFDVRDRHPMSLSGGQKQRVAIANALLSDTVLMCFDECTSGMDYTHMLEISKIIKDNIDEKKVILIISHDNEFLNMTADYIINIEDYIIN